MLNVILLNAILPSVIQVCAILPNAIMPAVVPPNVPAHPSFLKQLTANRRLTIIDFPVEKWQQWLNRNIFFLNLFHNVSSPSIWLGRCHDGQHDDTQHNVAPKLAVFTKHNFFFGFDFILHHLISFAKEIYRSCLILQLPSVISGIFYMLYCHYAECRYAERRDATGTNPYPKTLILF